MQKARDFDPNTPILFYSGAAFDRDKEQAFASGAQAYLTKPVENDELVKVVFRLISETKTKIKEKDLVAKVMALGVGVGCSLGVGCGLQATPLPWVSATDSNHPQVP